MGDEEIDLIERGARFALKSDGCCYPGIVWNVSLPLVESTGVIVTCVNGNSR